MFSLSHLVLVDLFLQDLISIGVNLHLFLFLQLPSQPGQILLESPRKRWFKTDFTLDLLASGNKIVWSDIPQHTCARFRLLLSLSRAVRFSATETWISLSLACVCSSCTFRSSASWAASTACSREGTGRTQ